MGGIDTVHLVYGELYGLYKVKPFFLVI